MGQPLLPSRAPHGLEVMGEKPEDIGGKVERECYLYSLGKHHLCRYSPSMSVTASARNFSPIVL